MNHQQTTTSISAEQSADTTQEGIVARPRRAYTTMPTSRCRDSPRDIYLCGEIFKCVTEKRLGTNGLLEQSTTAMALSMAGIALPAGDDAAKTSATLRIVLAGISREAENALAIAHYLRRALHHLERLKNTKARFVTTLAQHDDDRRSAGSSMK